MIQKKFFTEVVLLTKSYNLQDFKDWMHWHLDHIGFQRCHVFDNESSVDIKSVCNSYGDRVTYERITGWPNQYVLYNRYINNDSPAWWVLPIDDDEYLWMTDFTNVNSMILYYQRKWINMTKFSVRWLNRFPENPLEVRGNRSLMEFNSISNDKWADLFDGGNKPVKTFVNTVRPVNYNLVTNETHNPQNGDYSYLCNGSRLCGNWYYGTQDDTAVRLLHFQYKSKDEWMNKCRYGIDAGVKSRNHYNKNNEYIWKEMI